MAAFLELTVRLGWGANAEDAAAALVALSAKLGIHVTSALNDVPISAAPGETADEVLRIFGERKKLWAGWDAEAKARREAGIDMNLQPPNADDAGGAP